MDQTVEDLRSARWALRAAVTLLEPLLGDSPVEKFILAENAKCELTPLPEITPSCSTCRFARRTVCCAHPVTVKQPAARWCGEWRPANATRP